MNERNIRRSHSVGVVLFQLGGPDSLEAVEPFLYNLFSDPDIIDLPLARLARPTLARLIASRRAEHVRGHYTRIGGKSPIRDLTERQAIALERELQKTIDARVFVAMRYWHPLIEEVVRHIEGCAFCELVLLPLYPQYSTTTTGSSLNEWQRRYPRVNGKRALVKVIREFYDHPLYLEALAERINLGLQKFAPERPPSAKIEGEESAREAAPPSDAYLVFSAHGVPKKAIEGGDPYQAQVEATVKLVLERGRWPNPHVLCYQSRVGPGRWLQPSLDDTLRGIAARGVRRALVIPVSFVSEHVETLHEIKMEARELAQRLGLHQFETMPALNDSPTFIRALADLVLTAVGSH